MANNKKAVYDFSELSFDAALKELESMIQQMDSGHLALEDAVLAYERGIALQKYCEKKLDAARLVIEEIENDGEGLTCAAKNLEPHSSNKGTTTL